MTKWTDPNYCHHLEVQCFLRYVCTSFGVAALSYTGLRLFTSIFIERAAIFSAIDYLISYLTIPLFQRKLAKLQSFPKLIKYFNLIAMPAFTIISAKIICQLIGETLSFRQSFSVYIIFLITEIAIRSIMRYLSSFNDANRKIS